MVVLRGLEEIKIFQNSEKNSEVGGWVHGQLGLRKKMENRKPCAPLMISRSFRYFSFEHDLFVIYGVLLYVSFGNLLQFFLFLDRGWGQYYPIFLWIIGILFISSRPLTTRSHYRGSL